MSPTSPLRRLLAALVRHAGTAALVLAGGLVLLWLADVTGHGAPAGLARAVVLLTLAAAVLRGVLAGDRLLRQERPWGPALAAVLVAAFAFGFAGLAHEVGKGYYTDEGHYLNKARVVDEGKLLTRSFVYPHLTYYLDAFALWLAGLFPATVAWIAGALFGVEEAAAVDWLVLRWVTATLGSLTVLPVFLLARRVAGTLAAVLASGLVIFAVDYQEGFQVNVCDVPSAFFATLTLALVGRLFDGERTRDYVLAGAASGLAAAAKYPAGVVAVAIVAIWVVHRLRTRRWGWGLLAAGLTSLAVFLAANPSLFAFPDDAFQGPRGLFFGVNQYAGGGWVGVTPPSIPRFYLALLATNFGWPVLVLAAAGLFFLAPAARRRLALVAPFPLIYLALVCSMSMVVVRNVFPALPGLAVIVGAAAAGLTRIAVPRRRLLAAAVVVAALALPAAAAVRQTASLTRANTRDLMSAWIRAHLPVGAGILKEEYTPNFAAGEYRVLERRFAFRLPAASFADPNYDFLLVASLAYGRFFNPDNQMLERADWYRGLFDSLELVHVEGPSTWRRGPELRLYRLARPAAAPATAGEPAGRIVLAAADAFPTHPSMARAAGVVRFTEPGRTAVFRVDLAPGRYRLEAKGELRGDGRLEVRDLGNRRVATAEVVGATASFELAGAGPFFLALELPRGSRLARLALVRE